MRTATTLALYVVVNLALAMLWHLVLFKAVLAAATPFARHDPILALGMAAMVVQGSLLIWLYPRFHHSGSRAKSGLRFGILAGLFLATGAVWVEVGKFQFADGMTYVTLETVYEVASFAVLGWLIAWRYRAADVSQTR